MPITESFTIALEGEQAAVFAELDRREAEAIQTATASIRAERNAHVSCVLAAKGKLSDLQTTPNASAISLTVDADGVHVTVPPVPPVPSVPD